MNHRHTGPIDRACRGCFEEARETVDEIEARRRWRILIVVLLMAATIGAVALFAYFVKENGPHF